MIKLFNPIQFSLFLQLNKASYVGDTMIDALGKNKTPELCIMAQDHGHL